MGRKLLDPYCQRLAAPSGDGRGRGQPLAQTAQHRGSYGLEASQSGGESRSAFETRFFDAVDRSAVVDSCLTSKIRQSITSRSAITESLATCTLQPWWD